MEDKDLAEVKNVFTALTILFTRYIFQLGVSSEYIRKKIKAGVDEYQEMGERMKARFSSIENGETADPSAPPTETDEDVPSAPTLPNSDDDAHPSAPPIETFQSAECVVCMERKVSLRKKNPVFYSDCFLV